MGGVAYPLLLWYGLQHWSARRVGGLALLLIAALTALRVWRVPSGGRWAVAQAPVLAGLVLLGGVLLGDARWMMTVPTLVNLALLLTFGRSLREVPMAERYARLVHADLADDEIAYCRTVTHVWCGFFVCNAAVSAGLLLWAPVAWWAAFTGVLSYGFVGVLFAAEYAVRTVRFGARRRPSAQEQQ
ncbi:MAG: hypothetical protein FJ100_00365 [Deltaproteobacteria bacterium]|nr:hypothetical protein [Deltaproteobacteria bacterium]